MSPKAHKHLHYNVALVDKVWNLKRLCETHLKMHIPLNMVLKDEEYRADLLEKALTTENEELVALVWEIRKMEDAIVASTEDAEAQKQRKKSRNSFRIHVFNAAAFALIIFMSGYLLRSFLPMDAGEVFLFKAVQNVTVESRLKAKSGAASGNLTKADKPLFRLHGSNTIGEKLAPRLIEAYLMSQGANNVHTDVNPAAPNEKIISGEINGHIEFIELHAHGSGTAFSGLLKDETDMGMSSRPIKDKEREELLPKTGDLTLPGSEHVLGLDGLAIITSPSNAVSSLSIDQLVGIFSGEITNWSQLGGKDLPIKIYARDDKSGTWDSFKALVLDSRKAKLSESAVRVESSSELSDSVAREAGAIGFIGLPYVRHAKLIAISSSDKNKAIMPTHFTVGTEDYPLARRLFFYTPQVNPNIEAQEFIHFVVTERGQSIVEDVGFVSQNIKLGKPFDNDFYPTDMRELTARSERLSINFRFKSGSDELDTKSLNDLDRVARYVEVNAPKRVQLFGFSDSEGDAGKGKELSERRAKVVEQQLIQRGIYPLVAKGMGDAAPLAASNTEEGKNINRRVEVWIL
ncbi:membrane protein [Cellvibrio zantedeschiae]|uniref:Membrane protein n=1 Tax=Cellvibrio zantedeschiae TaxID=1237077 RepID=A0ABQ3AMT7_9GAMM|nr:phosphate ABC transporter substrate-binding/OmpA family protein [Cellvibrio zantedeschiae]GGY62273.1 membrane protein [Cellvibrio zantedeschiae]